MIFEGRLGGGGGWGRGIGSMARLRIVDHKYKNFVNCRITKKKASKILLLIICSYTKTLFEERQIIKV